MWVIPKFLDGAIQTCSHKKMVSKSRNKDSGSNSLRETLPKHFFSRLPLYDATTVSSILTIFAIKSNINNNSQHDLSVSIFKPFPEVTTGGKIPAALTFRMQFVLLVLNITYLQLMFLCSPQASSQLLF